MYLLGLLETWPHNLQETMAYKSKILIKETSLHIKLLGTVELKYIYEKHEEKLNKKGSQNQGIRVHLMHRPPVPTKEPMRA